MGLVINKGAKIKGTLASGTGDPILTRDTTTSDLGSITNNVGSLTSGKIWIGSVSNLPAEQTVSGDITLTNAGVAAIGTGVIVNTDVNASAGIALSKLAATTASRALVSDGSGFLVPATTTATEIGYVNGVTSSIQTQLNAKQATITGAASTVVSADLTANTVAVSNGSGKITSSAVSTTALGYIATLSSAAQTQLNTKLTTSLGALATGDIIYYNGTSWTNLPKGSSGQALYSTGGSIQWDTPTINGIPTGGTVGQVLAKLSGTDFDADWHTTVLADISDVTATASQVNVLDTGFYDATSSVQTQIDSKLNKTLAQNSLFVGDASNLAVALATGADGYVLSSVLGVPTWTSPGSGGTVTSISGSGGTTGLSFSGSPITTSGTLTLSGTLVVANGGTGVTSIAAKSIWLANSANTITSVTPGAGQSIRINAGNTAWEAYTSLTNAAANNELMKSNGTNAIASGVFVSTDGNITLGSSSVAGSSRTISAVKSGGGDTDINISPNAAGFVRITGGGVDINGNSFLSGSTVPSNSIYSGVGISGTQVSNSTTIFRGAPSSVSGVVGGDANLTGGIASSGNTSGGNVNISSGTPNGSGAETAVNIQTRSGGKIGFYNTTAIIQPTTAIASATLVLNASVGIYDLTTFDGYTIAQVVKALRNLGLLQ